MGTWSGVIANVYLINRYATWGVLQCRISIKSSQNQDIIKKLIKEVKGHNPSFEASAIRGEETNIVIEVCLGNFFNQ